jgi:hypothetical protein
MTTLYHYTCEHTRAAIGASGHLMPMRMHAPQAVERIPPEYPWLADTVWLTDLAEPDRGALGLTSFTLSCDRTAVRYVADNPPAVPFHDWSRGLARDVRKAMLRGLVYTEPEARPASWWVATEPVAVRLG